MVTIQFSEDEIRILEHERYTYPHPRIQEKLEAVYLKSMGVAHGEICRLCNISRPTLVKYLHSYQANGIDGLKRWKYAGRPSELATYSSSLEEHFKHHPPATSTQAVEEIERLTGIKRSPTQIREFMRRVGMRFRKTGFVPKGVQDERKQQEQEEFAKKNSRAIFRKPRRGGVWCFS
jgi:transposase